MEKQYTVEECVLVFNYSLTLMNEEELQELIDNETIYPHEAPWKYGWANIENANRIEMKDNEECKTHIKQSLTDLSTALTDVTDVYKGLENECLLYLLLKDIRSGLKPGIIDELRTHIRIAKKALQSLRRNEYKEFKWLSKSLNPSGAKDTLCGGHIKVKILNAVWRNLQAFKNHPRYITTFPEDLLIDIFIDKVEALGFAREHSVEIANAYFSERGLATK